MVGHLIGRAYVADAQRPGAPSSLLLAAAVNARSRQHSAPQRNRTSHTISALSVLPAVRLKGHIRVNRHRSWPIATYLAKVVPIHSVTTLPLTNPTPKTVRADLIRVVSPQHGRF